MEFTQIKETCLYVKDLDKTEQFYHRLLGLPIISRVDGRHIFFRAGTSVLLCFIAEATRTETTLPPHYASGKQHIAFEVGSNKYQTTKVRFQELGIVMTHEQDWKGGLHSFYFEDPDGHVLEVVQTGIWE